MRFVQISSFVVNDRNAMSTRVKKEGEGTTRVKKEGGGTRVEKEGGGTRREQRMKAEGRERRYSANFAKSLLSYVNTRIYVYTYKLRCRNVEHIFNGKICRT